MKPNQLIRGLAASSILVSSAYADPVTDNDYDDFNPIVSGDLIVWQAYVPGDEPPPEPEEGEEPATDDIEIFVKYGDEIRQITDNDGDDTNIKVSGNSLVWQSWDGSDWEIWAYNAEADVAEQLTDNEGDDINPCIDGNNVVWQGMEDAESDYEIFSQNIASMVPVEATLRINPRSLNLRSRGRWISVTLIVPTGDPELGDVDPDTILLQGSISPETVAGRAGNLRMKFDRQALQDLLSGPGDAEVSITAETTTGSVITGTDTIKVIP